MSVLIWLLSWIGEAADACKSGFRVVDEGKSLEVSFIWPNSIVTAKLLHDCSFEPEFLLQDSNIIGLKAPVVLTQRSSIQMIVSRGLINLPTTVSRDINELFNIGIETRGLLDVFIRLTIHKKQS